MMIKAWNEKTPALHPEARLAETAVVVGDVVLDRGASLWYGAVVRGDTAPIRIGENSNLQDNVVVHTDDSYPVTVGKNVTVGHGAILHGCTVGDGALIGMGAVLLNGCAVGEGAVVAAGALVPGGAVIPPRTLAVGAPAKVKRELREEELSGSAANTEEYLHLSRQLPAAGDGDCP